MRRVLNSALNLPVSFILLHESTLRVCAEEDMEKEAGEMKVDMYHLSIMFNERKCR